MLFDMPLSSPSEEVRLARQLEYHQWPDHLELECSELVDFDLDRLQSWGSPEEYLPEGWEVDSELQMEGNCTLALVRTEEPYDGPTCWFLGRGGAATRRGLYGTRTTLGPPSSEMFWAIPAL